MDNGSLAAIIVSLVAAAGAYMSQRAAAKAAKVNAESSGRMKMEDEAYDRAREYDTDTITRQKAEIDALRIQNDTLQRVHTQNRHLNEDVKRVSKDNDQLHAENTRLVKRVEDLESEVAVLKQNQPHSSEEYYDGAQ